MTIRNVLFHHSRNGNRVIEISVCKTIGKTSRSQDHVSLSALSGNASTVDVIIVSFLSSLTLRTNVAFDVLVSRVFY